MKKLLFLFIAITLVSCTIGQAEVKDSTLIYNSFSYNIYKVKIDSIDYLIATTPQGISIIKK